MRSISIAKALRTRKQLKGQISDLSKRATGCATWIEGASRDFDFTIVDLDRKAKIDELVRLETAIAVANATATVTWQGRAMPLTEVIRRQEELKGEIVYVTSLSTRRGPERQHTGEYSADRQPVMVTVNWCSAYSEPERVLHLASLRAQCEELNELLEEANHRNTVALA